MKQKESLYRQCSAAIDRLITKPPKEHGGVFTEIDVETEAAKVAKNWTAEDYRQALHDAGALCGTQYRGRKLCRYGPVVLADGTEDYARIADKIVYSDAETGPEYWETPNGKFPKLMIEDDSLGRQGRRSGTSRNDALPWDDQSSPKPRRIRRRKASSVLKAKNDAEILEIIASLTERVQELEDDKRKLEKLYA